MTKPGPRKGTPPPDSGSHNSVVSTHVRLHAHWFFRASLLRGLLSNSHCSHSGDFPGFLRESRGGCQSVFRCTKGEITNRTVRPVDTLMIPCGHSSLGSFSTDIQNQLRTGPEGSHEAPLDRWLPSLCSWDEALPTHLLSQPTKEFFVVCVKRLLKGQSMFSFEFILLGSRGSPKRQKRNVV